MELRTKKGPKRPVNALHAYIQCNTVNFKMTGHIHKVLILKEIIYVTRAKVVCSKKKYYGGIVVFLWQSTNEKWQTDRDQRKTKVRAEQQRKKREAVVEDICKIPAQIKVVPKY